MGAIGTVSGIIGIAWPWVKSPGGVPQSVTNADAINANLEVLYSTEPGEDANLPPFGTPLNGFLFETTGSLLDSLLSAAISRATQRWEPRAVVQGVETSTTTDPNGLTNIEVTVNWIYAGQNYSTTASRTSSAP